MNRLMGMAVVALMMAGSVAFAGEQCKAGEKKCAAAEKTCTASEKKSDKSCPAGEEKCCAKKAESSK